MSSFSITSSRSHLFITTIKSLSFTKENTCSSLGENLSEPSSKMIAISDLKDSSFVFFMPIDSSSSGLSDIPAVSERKKGIPLISMYSLTISRVVPGILLTITRSYLIRLLSNVELPQFGLPMILHLIPLIKMFSRFFNSTKSDIFSINKPSWLSRLTNILFSVSSSGKSIIASRLTMISFRI